VFDHSGHWYFDHIVTQCLDQWSLCVLTWDHWGFDHLVTGSTWSLGPLGHWVHMVIGTLTTGH